MSILARSMFEYQQKAEYLPKHRKQAFEQYGSIGARKHTVLSKLAHPNPQITLELTAQYLEWKRTSGDRDERSGNVVLSKMHLENVDPNTIKTDKDGNQYTEHYQTAYGLPSLHVHGEAMMMPEVFHDANDDSDWEFRDDTTYFDAVSMLNSANTSLISFCVKTSKAYDLSVERIYSIREAFANSFDAMMELHGSDKRIVRRQQGAAPP